MNFLPYIKIAYSGFIANKARSLLTMLGIIIGVGSIIIIISVGSGTQSLIINQIKSVGSNLIGVMPGASDEEGPPASVMGISITTLTFDDVEAVLKPGKAPHVVAGTGYVQGTITASWFNRNIDTNFTGVGSDHLEVEDASIEEGRFFTDDENRNLSRVAVLGTKVVEDLFSGNDPIGETIKIKKTNFKIIGIMEERGVSGFQNLDNQIYIPLSTAQKLILGINHISLARFKVDLPENIDRSIEDIEMTLREQHDINDPSQDDFTVSSQLQALEVLTSITNALKFFLASIAAVSLVVGGIGIMNIMLSSVTERTREIGLRKALGATKKNIIWQILIETVSITLLGGLLGLAIGTFFSFIVALGVNYFGYDWDFSISIFSIILGVGVSMLVGLAFGLYPARRAAELNPIEALRKE